MDSSTGAAASVAMTAGSMAVVGGCTAMAAASGTGVAGASATVVSSIQGYALLSKVPAIYTRMPTFAAFFGSASWTNLQGIPGFWGAPNASNSTDDDSSTLRRRRLADASDSTAGSSGVALYFNCSVGSETEVDLNESSSDVMQVRCQRLRHAWTSQLKKLGLGFDLDVCMLLFFKSQVAPDIIGDIYSTWFYSVLAIFLMILGHSMVAAIIGCTASSSRYVCSLSLPVFCLCAFTRSHTCSFVGFPGASIEIRVERSLENTLGKLLEEHMSTAGASTPFNNTAVASIRARLSSRHDAFVNLAKSNGVENSVPSTAEANDDATTSGKAKCNCVVLVNKAVYFLLNTLFVRSTDLQPDFKSRVRGGIRLSRTMFFW